MNGIYIIIIMNIFCTFENFFSIPFISKLSYDNIITEIKSGLIFSAFYIGNIFIFPLKSVLLNNNKKNLLIISLLFQSISFILFSYILFNIKIFQYYIYFLLIFRFLQGIFTSLINTILYSNLVLKSSKNNLKFNTMIMELFYILSLVLSPFLSYFFYIKFEFIYFFCFYLFKLILLIILSKTEIKSNEINETNLFIVSFNPQIFLNCIIIIIQKSSINFFFPAIIKHLSQYYKKDIKELVFFFSIQIISFYLSLPFIRKIKNFFGSKLAISISLFINFIFTNFIYPANFLPHKIIIIKIGLILIGFSESLITISSIEDFIIILISEYKYNINLSNDYASGLYNLCDNLGKAFGTFIGGYYTEKFNFELCCFFISLHNIIFFFIFIFCSLNFIQNQIILSDKNNTKKIKKKILNNINENINIDGIVQFSTDKNSWDISPFIINIENRNNLIECVMLRTSTFNYGRSVSTFISNL